MNINTSNKDHNNLYREGIITRWSSPEVESTIRIPVNIGGLLPKDNSRKTTLPYKMRGFSSILPDFTILKMLIRCLQNV